MDGDLVKDDSVQHADGTFENAQQCAYSHYTSDGEEVTADARDPKISHSWIEAVWTYPVNPKGSFGGMTTEWKVPPAPTTNHGQTIYFFPGFQACGTGCDGNTKTILQPVLGWNAYYKDQWGIASWNCCVAGTVYVSTPRPTEAGHTIGGLIVDTCKAGTVECSSWNIITEDLTTGAGTELAKTSNFKQTFNQAFTNVLEVYSVVDCGDYPSNGKLLAEDIKLYNDDFQSIPLTDYKVIEPWLLTIFKVSPECGYGASEADNFKDITIRY